MDFMVNVEDVKLLNLDGEMLLKLYVNLFILTDWLVSKLFKFLLQCEENTEWHKIKTK